MCTVVSQKTSGLLDRTYQQLQVVQQSQLALGWSVLNLALAGIFSAELVFGSINHMLSLTHPIVWYTECVLACVFLVNSIVDLVRYLRPGMLSHPVEMTSQQRRLLGVTGNVPGFRTSPVKPLSPRDEKKRETESPVLLPTMSASLTPVNPSPPQPNPLYMSSPYLGGSGHYSPATPPSRPPSAGSGMSPALRDLSLLDSSGSRLRHRSAPVSPAQNSPVIPEEDIRNMDDLQNYLQQFEEREMINQLGGDTSPGANPTMWNYSRSSLDYTQVLRRYQYQMASRSPQSTTTHSKDSPDLPDSYGADEHVWGKLGVRRDELDAWTANLRKWISQTILVRLVREINRINSAMRRIGCADVQVGDVSLSSLRHVAVTKQQHVRSLTSLLPYLDMSSNQEYLVSRVKELAQGGSMSEFRWNSGGTFKNRKWDQDLPTDSAIIMHMFCTYLDSRLPPHPKFPDGRTFTGQHFIKTPEEPDLKKKDNLLLHQAHINPPHFTVVVGDQAYQLHRGRCNLFHAILLLLHRIKTKEYGMLGQVNLGPSGVNLLWIFDST
ncbi:PREDICTED: transmembrane protein 209-like [Branchiostoma belcheri]|uniref:Transmembrane protein 209 n=1 Tax=Branchiostoma belcheri TaxID=7741 RepID=A0A6P4ZTA9_BRABE|nr:PREDICTED: transmembrane protein 209-like [Branchiostoma belcheri]